MNPEEGEYLNVDYINYFDMPFLESPKYLEQQLWDPQLQCLLEWLEAQFQHNYNLRPRKDQETSPHNQLAKDKHVPPLEPNPVEVDPFPPKKFSLQSDLNKLGLTMTLTEV